MGLSLVPPVPATDDPVVTRLSALTASLSTHVVRADEQVLPVDARLHEVLPWAGLRRGSVLEVHSRALGWVLVAQAMQAGSWAAAVGTADPCWAAAAELGVPLSRLAVVAPPPQAVAGTVLAALVDALDIVLVDPSVAIRPHELRRVIARARERRSVLISLGAVGKAWEGVDVRLGVTATRWHGLQQGTGAITGCEVDLEATGRGAAMRPRRTTLWLQGSGGRWDAHASAPLVDTVSVDSVSVDSVSVDSVSVDTVSVDRSVDPSFDGHVAEVELNEAVSA